MHALAHAIISYKKYKKIKIGMNARGSGGPSCFLVLSTTRKIVSEPITMPKVVSKKR